MAGAATDSAVACEICNTEGVDRQGVWDFCSRGHVYVGERADDLNRELSR